MKLTRAGACLVAALVVPLSCGAAAAASPEPEATPDREVQATTVDRTKATTPDGDVQATTVDRTKRTPDRDAQAATVDRSKAARVANILGVRRSVRSYVVGAAQSAFHRPSFASVLFIGIGF